MRRPAAVIRMLALLVVMFAPAPARAFCGFYVSGAGAPLYNAATQVVLMRHGVRTVLAMQNDYAGPPEDFALVVPVPVVLAKENVRTLPRDLFDRVDKLDAPRLVEYWEKDPCEAAADLMADAKEGGTGARAKGEEGSMGGPKRPLVVVEAEFSVDEYDVVILSALDAAALETWLRDNRYRIPPGAEPYLRPYVQGGSKFFVARVDARKVEFHWGKATLSPLRFHYDSESFSLPVRLGLMNARGPQDLVVHVIAEQRHEAANYENLLIPTNLEVKDETRDQYPAFYAALFDRTVAGHPKAVVTEYAWGAASCDPCPTPPLSPEDLLALGADVVPAAPMQSFVLTRLHARYTRDTLGEDLVLRAASGIEGGREPWRGRPRPGATPGGRFSAFQGRYVIRHAWEGRVQCEDPVYGDWGGSPGGGARAPTPATRDAPRRALALDQLILPDESRARPPAAAATPRLLRVVAAAWARFGWVHVGALGAAFLSGAVVVIVAARRARQSPLRPLLALFFVGALPIALLLESQHRRVVREAGTHAVPVAMVFFVGLGLVLARRLRDDRARFLAPLLALAPLAAGIWRTGAAFAVTAEAAREIVDDTDLQGLVYAGGQSEALAVLTLGLWTSAALLVTAAFPGRAAGAQRPLVPALPALVVSALGAAAYARIHAGASPWSHGGALPFAGVIAAAGIVAVALARSPDEPGGAGPPLAHRLARAGLCVGLAACFVSAADIVMIHARALGAVSGMSVDPEQKARILATMIAAERQRAALLPLDVLLAILPLAPVARHRGRALLDRATLQPLASGLGAAALLLAGALWQERTFDAHLVHVAAQHARFDDPRGAALPVVHRSGGSSGSADGAADARLGGPALWVTAQGALLASPATAVAPEPYRPALFDELAAAASEAGAARAPLLAADGALHLDALLRALEPLLARRQTDYRLLEDGRTPEARAASAYRAVLTGLGIRDFAVEIAPTLTIAPPAEPASAAKPGRRARSLGLLVEGDRARAVLLEGRSGLYERARGAAPRDVPLGLSEQEIDQRTQALGVLASRIEEVVLACHPSTDVATIARTIAALAAPRSESRFDRRAGAKGLFARRFVLSADTGSMERAVGGRE